MKNPTFLGIGAQKCATTFIAECLKSHPEIFMSSPKELHFFGHDKFELGLDHYLKFFKKGEQKIVGEFSPSYLTKAPPMEIYNALGRIKIVIALRDPIKRFISHYMQLIRKGELKNIKVDLKVYNEIINLFPNLLIFGKYHSYIVKYIEVFGNQNILILFKRKY